MGSIEVVYLSIGAIILLLAMARGATKDLGATLIILVAIFILTFPEEAIASVIERGVNALFGNRTGIQVNRVQATVFSLLFTIMVFTGYVGKTLEFPKSITQQPAKFLVSVLVGVINGYLIAGTLWYYQDKYGYPWFEEFVPTFSDAAERMIALLPPGLFDNPVFWVVPVAILLLIRVRK